MGGTMYYNIIGNKAGHIITGQKEKKGQIKRASVG
jgi:hypothetical protein